MKPVDNAPSKTMLAFELPRAALEYFAGWMSQGHLTSECEKGDGPVIVIPGLATSDSSTSMLRTFLSSLGYTVSGWNRGMNRGPTGGFDEFLASMLLDVEKAFNEHGKPVRLLGWSLGGVYVRELAKLAPHMVRQVITLGTPFSGNLADTNGGKMFEILSRSDCHKDPLLQRRVARTPSVPTVSIYSKTDGIVAWQCCLNPKMGHTENVEMSSVCHLGLVTSPAVFRVIAHRMSAVAEKDAAVEVTKIESGKVIQVEFRAAARKLRRAA